MPPFAPRGQVAYTVKLQRYPRYYIVNYILPLATLVVRPRIAGMKYQKAGHGVGSREVRDGLKRQTTCACAKNDSIPSAPTPRTDQKAEACCSGPEHRDILAGLTRW